MSTFVAIDCNDADDVAAMSSYLETSVYPYLQSKGLNMAPFIGPLARPEYVASAARSLDVTLLTGAGHGTYTSFIGFSAEPVFDHGTYTADEVSGKIAHFLSCQNAKLLGPEFVKNGCLAYIGYDEDFVFNPLSEDLFFKCDGQILLGLADGLTVGDAVTKAKDLFTQTIADFMAAGNADAASQLQYDLSHLRSPLDGLQWGSVDAKLT